MDTTLIISFVPFKSSSISLERLEVPRICFISTSFKGSLVANSYAVLAAASATPPDAPKMVPAPVYSPNGESGASVSNALKLIPASLIILPNSWVVKT